MIQATTQHILYLCPIGPLADQIDEYFAFDERHREAVEWLQRAVDTDPGFVWAQLYLARAYTALDVPDKALAAYRALFSALGFFGEMLASFDEAGDGANLRGAYEWMSEHCDRESGFIPYLIYAETMLGRTAETLEVAEIVGAQSPLALAVAFGDPVLAELRVHPRIRAILKN